MEAAEEKEVEAFSCVVNKVRDGQCLPRDVDVYFLQQLFKSKIQRGFSDPRPEPGMPNPSAQLTLPHIHVSLPWLAS